MKKIAFPTDDGETISPHLGRAPFYIVATVDDSEKIAFEKRDKAHHGAETEHSVDHGTMHETMFAAIKDCQVLISGGMGEPAYQHAQAQGLEIVLPAEKNIKLALEAYRAGTLVSDARRIHKH